MTTSFTLSYNELRWAAKVGIERQIRCRERGTFKKGRVSKKEVIWDYDIEGAAAELAAARVLDIGWPATIDNFKGPDLDMFIQVRHSQIASAHLLLKPNDNQEHCYVLVTGKSPTFVMAGWIWGAVYRNPAETFICDNGGTVWIPQKFLTPIEELKEYVWENLRIRKYV